MIGPTAAELAAQNELSEKLALLRSQEANLSEQLTTVSNKLAQYNTDLEKVNTAVSMLFYVSGVNSGSMHSEERNTIFRTFLYAS